MPPSFTVAREELVHHPIKESTPLTPERVEHVHILVRSARLIANDAQIFQQQAHPTPARHRVVRTQCCLQPSGRVVLSEPPHSTLLSRTHAVLVVTVVLLKKSLDVVT